MRAPKLHAIYSALSNSSKEEKRMVFSLLTTYLVTLVVSSISFWKGSNGTLSYTCIPGDVSLMSISILGIYLLSSKNLKWAANLIYLGVIPIYFYFISADNAIMPIHLTVHFTLWALTFSTILLLFSTHSLKKITAFYVLGLILICVHLWEAERAEAIISLFWIEKEYVLNPLITLSLGFFICFSVMWSFKLNLKEIRTKLEENEETMNNTLRQLQQGYMLLKINRDERGSVVNLQILKANNAFEALFKINSRELKNADADVVLPKIFRNYFEWNQFLLHSKKRKTEINLEHLHKWVELTTLVPSKDHIICLFSDITPKQQAIISLKESRKRYKVLLEAIPDLFFIIDKDGIYVDFVIKDQESLLIDPDDIIGNTIYEVGFSERMSRKIFQYIQDAIRFDTIETIEYALEIEKGTAMFEMRIAKLDDNSVIAIARDITKRKMAEIRLEEAKQKAEESDQLKSAFLANISHEIRTPMNAIIGFSRMLATPDFDDDERTKFIEIIINNGRLLMEMINDMISISKIESNQVVLHKGFCKINDLMVDLFREYSIEVSNKPVKLKLSNENANPKFGLSTDRYLLTEILKKLIDNAIKFTNEGEIEFGYSMDGKAHIRFFIKDTGIGIEEQNQSKIFDRFHQIDNKKSRKYEGTGLGLAIAQHYAILLGGEIKVKSKVDLGSTFSFSIPFENGDGMLTIVR